ncbi:MAG: hypothetical protein ACR2HG_02450 [Pyrinomonadaceae bacterium]
MSQNNGETYKSWAMEALSYTVGKLSLGRGNSLADWYTLGPDEAWYSGPGKQLSMLWGMAVLRSYEQIGDDVKLVQCRANVAKGVQTGNCQEHAAVAFDYLAKLGCRPVAIMGQKNHAFTIVGFDLNCNFNQPSSFPDWSWVSDPWKRQIYKTNTLSGSPFYEPVIMLREKDQYPNYLNG